MHVWGAAARRVHSRTQELDWSGRVRMTIGKCWTTAGLLLLLGPCSNNKHMHESAWIVPKLLTPEFVESFICTQDVMCLVVRERL